jgi:tRNA G18 (ribose-2'-O)-methylase SpoU
MAIFQRVDNLSDPRLDPYRDLKQTNRTRWSDTFIAEGDKLVERLLASRYATESILMAERFVEAWQARLPPALPVYVLPDAKVEELVGFNFHRGVLACGRRLPDPTLVEIIPPAPKPVSLVVLPDVQSPENLGVILRISAAFGVDAVLLGPRAGDPLSRRVLRTSMGYALHVPLITLQEPVSELARLAKEHDLTLIATTLDPRAVELRTLEPMPRQAILFGSEGHGLEPEYLRLCDHLVTIPMRSGIDSLNVGVAAGIVLHHLLPTVNGSK